MKNRALAFALGALALSSGICVAQEAAERVALPGSKLPSLKCCQCIAGASNVVAPLDLSTGQSGPVKWSVNGSPTYVTIPYNGWLTLPGAQWVQSVNSSSPAVVGSGPFAYATAFSVPQCAIPFSAVQLNGTYAADNGATISLVPPGTPGTPCPGPYCFQAPGKTFTFSPVAPGAHTLNVAVTNQGQTISGLLVKASLAAKCPVCPPPGVAGACCEPKPGSAADCSNPIMNLGHPQDVGNPLGHTFGKARCEAINGGNSCAWNASKPGCKISSPPAVSCAPPPPATHYNTGSTSANNVPLNQCYQNTVGECLYNFAVPGTPGGWNTGCPAAVAGANCCGWK